MTTLLFAFGAAGCGPAYIQDTEIEDTEENREIYLVVQAYQRAIEGRDIQTLQELVSSRYYENASTTDVASDDYGRDEILVDLLPSMAENVDKVFYKVDVKGIRRGPEAAKVNFEYVLKFRYNDGVKSQWAFRSDVNQLDLVREHGAWKILSGM